MGALDLIRQMHERRDELARIGEPYPMDRAVREFLPKFLEFNKKNKVTLKKIQHTEIQHTRDFQHTEIQHTRDFQHTEIQHTRFSHWCMLNKEKRKAQNRRAYLKKKAKNTPKTPPN